MEENEREELLDDNQKNKRLNDIKSGVFMATLTGFSLLFGFGASIALTKKQDPNNFAKGMTIYQQGISESGGSLALRALGRATLYSVGTIGLASFIVWKLMGVGSMQEFTGKIQAVMPKIPKRKSEGKSDFKTIRELVDYLINEDRKTNK